MPHKRHYCRIVTTVSGEAVNDKPEKQMNIVKRHII